MAEKRAKKEVHSDDAEGFLLQRCVNVQHSDMNDDLAGFVVGMRLKFDAHPPVALVAAAETARGDCVGKGKK